MEQIKRKPLTSIPASNLRASIRFMKVNQKVSRNRVWGEALEWGIKNQCNRTVATMGYLIDYCNQEVEPRYLATWRFKQLASAAYRVILMSTLWKCLTTVKRRSKKLLQILIVIEWTKIAMSRIKETNSNISKQNKALMLGRLLSQNSLDK